MTRWEWVGLGGTAVVAAAAFVVLVWLNRRGVRLLGPVFWYELVKLARRGQQPRLRVLLVSLLLVGLFITYLREFRGEELAALTGRAQVQLDRTARFANTFLTAFLSAQLFAVILITPAVVGGAITEEKERGTLDFLRSSLLTNREIVFGKLAARLAFVAGVVLAGVPVLALTSLFGGVDVYVLGGGYLITAVTALSLGSFSLLMSVKRDSLRDVLVWVYGATAVLSLPGLCCGCVPGVAAVSPVSVLGYMLGWEERYGNPEEPLFWVNLGAFTALHGTAAVVLALVAVAGVRSAPPRRRPVPKRRPKPPPPPPDDFWVFRPLPLARRANESEDDRDEVPTPSARRSFHPARLGDGDPFLWKERHFAGRLSWVGGGALAGCGVASLSVVGFVLGMVLFFTALYELNRGHWIGEAVNPVARLFLTGGALLIGLALGARSAAAVASERQKQTLDGLLTLPVERSSILRAKWLAPLAWVRWGLMSLGLGGAFAVFTGGVHLLGFVGAGLQIVGWLALSDTLGLWLSVRCRSVTRATVYFAVCVLVLWFGPLVLTPLATALAGDAGEVTAALSLPVGVWTDLFSWSEFAEMRAALHAETWRMTRVAGAVAGVLYLGAAALLWLDAVRRFEKEGK